MEKESTRLPRLPGKITHYIQVYIYIYIYIYIYMYITWMVEISLWYITLYTYLYIENGKLLFDFILIKFKKESVSCGMWNLESCQRGFDMSPRHESFVFKWPALYINKIYINIYCLICIIDCSDILMVLVSTLDKQMLYQVPGVSFPSHVTQNNCWGMHKLLHPLFYVEGNYSSVA